MGHAKSPKPSVQEVYIPINERTGKMEDYPLSCNGGYQYTRYVLGDDHNEAAVDLLFAKLNSSHDIRPGEGEWLAEERRRRAARKTSGA